MPLLDIWAKTPDQLEDKQVHQLIAFAGGGKLLDESSCSEEFRSFLAIVPSKKRLEQGEARPTGINISLPTTA